jgi:hypothetical protein
MATVAEKNLKIATNCPPKLGRERGRGVPVNFWKNGEKRRKSPVKTGIKLLLGISWKGIYLTQRRLVGNALVNWARSGGAEGTQKCVLNGIRRISKITFVGSAVMNPARNCIACIQNGAVGRIIYFLKISLVKALANWAGKKGTIRSRKLRVGLCSGKGGNCSPEAPPGRRAGLTKIFANCKFQEDGRGRRPDRSSSRRPGRDADDRRRGDADDHRREDGVPLDGHSQRMETEEPAQVYTIYPLGYRNHLGTCRTKSRTAAWPEILKVVEIEKCREYFYEECKHGMAEVGYVVPRPGPLESPLMVSRTSNKFPMGKLIGQAVARPGPRESFPSGSGKGVTIVQAGIEMGKMPDYFVHRQANRRRKVWERNSMGNGWKNEKLRKNKCFAGPGKILRPETQRQGRPPARRPPGARPSSRRAPLIRGQDLDMMTEEFFCIRKMAVSGICQSITLNVMAVPHETLGLITTMEFLPVQFIGYGGGPLGPIKVELDGTRAGFGRKCVAFWNS